VEEVFLSIQKAGDSCLEINDFYNALWKYEHAKELVKSCSSLERYRPFAMSNAALTCIRLGDAEVTSINRRVYWYYHGYRHADSALSINPSPDVASKVWLELHC